MSYVLSLTQFLVSVPSGTMNVFLSPGSSLFPSPFIPAHVILSSEAFQKLFLYRKKKKETLCQNLKVANALVESFNLKKKEKEKSTIPIAS